MLKVVLRLRFYVSQCSLDLDLISTLLTTHVYCDFINFTDVNILETKYDYVMSIKV